MNAFQTKLSIGFQGTAIGIPTNSGLKTSVGNTARLSMTGTGWQAYDAFSTTPLTILASATTTLNLLTGLLNPLGEAISGAPFAHVFGVFVWHDPASLAVSGIEAFGGASSNLFQGPLNSTGKFTLLVGKRFAFTDDSNLTGWVVDATHKNIDIKNLDASFAATVRVLVVGKTT